MATKAQRDSIKALNKNQIRQTQKDKILELLKDGPVTREDLAFKLMKQKSTISARIAELQSEGLVINVGTKEYKDKANMSLYALTPEDQIEDEKYKFNKNQALQLTNTLKRRYKEYLPVELQKALG